MTSYTAQWESMHNISSH